MILVAVIFASAILKSFSMFVHLFKVSMNNTSVQLSWLHLVKFIVVALTVAEGSGTMLRRPNLNINQWEYINRTQWQASIQWHGHRLTFYLDSASQHTAVAWVNGGKHNWKKEEVVLHSQESGVGGVLIPERWWFLWITSLTISVCLSVCDSPFCFSRIPLSTPFSLYWNSSDKSLLLVFKADGTGTFHLRFCCCVIGPVLNDDRWGSPYVLSKCSSHLGKVSFVWPTFWS